MFYHAKGILHRLLTYANSQPVRYYIRGSDSTAGLHIVFAPHPLRFSKQSMNSPRTPLAKRNLNLLDRPTSTNSPVRTAFKWRSRPFNDENDSSASPSRLLGWARPLGSSLREVFNGATIRHKNTAGSAVMVSHSGPGGRHLDGAVVDQGVCTDEHRASAALVRWPGLTITTCTADSISVHHSESCLDIQDGLAGHLSLLGLTSHDGSAVRTRGVSWAHNTSRERAHALGSTRALIPDEVMGDVLFSCAQESAAAAIAMAQRTSAKGLRCKFRSTVSDARKPKCEREFGASVHVEEVDSQNAATSRAIGIGRRAAIPSTPLPPYGGSSPFVKALRRLHHLRYGSTPLRERVKAGWRVRHGDIRSSCHSDRREGRRGKEKAAFGAGDDGGEGVPKKGVGAGAVWFMILYSPSP